MEEMYTEKNMQRAILLGFGLGVLATIFFWIITAMLVEECKVISGYLTHRDRTYKVTLYDTLDTPDKDEKLKGD